MARRKVGVRRGGGPPPGYRWTVEILAAANEEAASFLDAEQYLHLAAQMRDLAAEEEPTRCPTVDVRPVEDFYEVRDKGGVLGRINARVFFCVDHARRRLGVLGAFNKKNDGATPQVVVVTIRRRMRQYLAGQ